LFCSYVEQLVASAEAAVEEVVRRGVSLFFVRLCGQCHWRVGHDLFYHCL
jgi:hypothetical protein